jgi:hypothetical protein
MSVQALPARRLRVSDTDAADVPEAYGTGDVLSLFKE